MNKTCSSCRWWIRNPMDFSVTIGACRANPPTVLLTSDGRTACAIPNTKHDEFCRLHEPAVSVHLSRKKEEEYGD